MPQYGDTAAARSRHQPPQRTAQPRAPHPQPQPQQPPAPVGAGAGSVNPALAGWQADPVLAQINAYYGPGGPFLTGAQGAYDKGVKELLTNYGYDPAFESLYPDANTKSAAQQNPFSILENLKHGHELSQRGINEQSNRENLWYSSTRGERLGEEGRQYLGQQSAASGALRGGISALGSALTGAQEQAAGKTIEGSQTAYGNWLASGLANPPPITAPGGVGGALRAAAPSTRNIQAQRRAVLRRRY